jgi:cell wall-associated NlpC family hydrolase
MMQIGVPLTDLKRSETGPRDRQLLLGDRVEVLETTDSHHRVKDASGYTGFIDSAATTKSTEATHWVSARLTQAFEAPDFKSQDQHSLSFTATVTALSETEKFIETAFGYIPKQHVKAIDNRPNDPAEMAATLLGTPYLWGGNSSLGIDCSGLIEAALRATGQPITARDSGDQQNTLGTPQPQGTAYRKNDLLFWKGHVALVSDPQTILHANAHHMATVYEDIDTAIARIKAQGDGDITAHKRL